MWQEVVKYAMIVQQLFSLMVVGEKGANDANLMQRLILIEQIVAVCLHF